MLACFSKNTSKTRNSMKYLTKTYREPTGYECTVKIKQRVQFARHQIDIKIMDSEFEWALRKSRYEKRRYKSSYMLQSSWNDIYKFVSDKSPPVEQKGKVKSRIIKTGDVVIIIPSL
ncbi:hypothetical protein ACOME3_002445 [Neoechinorhynchus agilis]